MKILLADDQNEVISGLKAILEQESQMHIVGEVTELGSLLIKAKESNPDILLLDWELSNMKVSDMIPLLRVICPQLKVIAMSTRPEASGNAFAAGVDAFVSKGEYPDIFLKTLKQFICRV